MKNITPKHGDSLMKNIHHGHEPSSHNHLVKQLDHKVMGPNIALEHRHAPTARTTITRLDSQYTTPVYTLLHHMRSYR